jgi:O-antigen/teichoic acid export membrane protein
MAGVIVAVVAGKPILSVLYGPTYAEYTTLFSFLMVAAAIGLIASLLNYAATAVRHFRLMLSLFTAQTALIVALCILLIPHQGLTGAVSAITAGFLFQLVGCSSVIIFAFRKTRDLSYQIGEEKSRWI